MPTAGSTGRCWKAAHSSRAPTKFQFHVGDYFRADGQAMPDPAFFDVVPVRVGLAAGRDYHVPLLISHFGYSTYRGS